MFREVSTHFRSSHDEDRPSWLDDGLPTPRGVLDLPYFTECPLHGPRQILVDVLEVLDNSGLIPITAAKGSLNNTIYRAADDIREEGDELLVIHRAIYGAFRDLEPIYVHYREHRA